MATGKSSTSVVTIGTGWTPIAAADPDRKSIAIGNPTSNAAAWGSNPNIATTQGVPLAATTGSVLLTRRDHGAIVTEALFARKDTGAQDMTVVIGQGD